MLINIMTPVWRTKNLVKIYESIPWELDNFYFNFCVVYDGFRSGWLCLKDEGKRTFEYMVAGTNGDDFAGHKKRNWFLDNVLDGYVYFCDDDNLIHPELFKNLVGKLDGTSIIMDQYNKNDSLRLSHTEPIEVGHVDVGNILINRKDIGDLRFEADKYEADGILFNEIFVKRGVPIKRDAEAKTYYNKLR